MDWEKGGESENVEDRRGVSPRKIAVGGGVGVRGERPQCDIQQVDRVGHAEHEEARAQQGPVAVGTPSPQREHAHDERREAPEHRQEAESAA